jgi:2-C-methyl-D-erythritol 4-phosphate cytidylyltransferase
MAQTPQVFRTNVYHAALAIAERDGITVTDDCSLAEHIEHPVRLVECSRDNIKLTTKDDITRAEAILRARTEEDRT